MGCGLCLIQLRLYKYIILNKASVITTLIICSSTSDHLYIIILTNLHFKKSKKKSDITEVDIMYAYVCKCICIWVFNYYKVSTTMNEHTYSGKWTLILSWNRKPISAGASKVYVPPPRGGIDIVFFGEVIGCPDHP